MKIRFATLVVLAGAVLIGGCGKGGDNRSKTSKAMDAQSATLQSCGEYVSPAGRPVQAYVVSFAGRTEKNLLLVVGATGPVTMENAASVKINGKPANERLRWAGGSGWVIAINGEAQVLTSNLGNKLINAVPGQAEPGKGPSVQENPELMLKSVTSGKKLDLPELDGPPGQ